MIKNILIRSLSGAVYVGLIVLSLLLLEHSSVVFLLVFGLFVVLGIKEVYDMTCSEQSESWSVILIDMLAGASLFVTLHLGMGNELSPRALWLLPACAYPLLRCIIQLYRPGQNAFRSLERSFFAMIYVVLPLSMLNAIVALTTPKLLLAVFIFIWVNDTGAFLSGVALGRHRLWERISPKKSWEGFFGGLLACIICAWATAEWCNDFFQVPPLTVWIGLSVVVSIAATYGDLTESLLKRTEGVKDSGHLIPGHGGLLDRIDSLLLVAPAVVLYLILVIYH